MPAMPATVQCIQCGKKCEVIPSRAASFKFCSYACRGEWRKANFTGAANPRWTEGPRVKTCGHCGNEYEWKAPKPYSSFLASKFCSKQCSDRGAFRHEGEQHPNWKPESRRKASRGKHGAWARAVISRDKATCQHCGSTGVELHAHHVKSFADFPELRWEVSNGITLCHSCHWAVHTASNANAVNSGNTLTDHAEGNPEPSFRGNLVEGVTTRGRAYKRVESKCGWCGTFVSKPASDAKGKKNLFCSKQCSGKFNAANRTYRRWKNPPAHGSNASTSAARESDDIV